MSPTPGIRVTALALDVDGTLLDPSHRIRPPVRDAVADLPARGVTVILASARFPGALREIQSELGLAGSLLVACQGAVVGWFSDERLVRVQEVSLADASARTVMALAAAAGLAVSHFSADAWHVAAGDPMAGQEAAIVGCQPTVVADLRDLPVRPSKLTVMAPRGREGELDALALALPANVRASTSRPDYLEIVDGGVSKASALEAALAHLGIPVGQLAAAGDGQNDEEMLRLASVSIAMGHAPATLRAIATYTVPSNGDDGLAVGIRRLLADGLVGPG